MTGVNVNSVARPVADFKPSPWGNQFLHYIPDTKAIETQQELARELKVELDKELLSIHHKPLIEQLRLIGSIERLNVAYHFEKEIEDVLQCIHDMPNTCSCDLYLTSLRFRLLRQHGFKVSCDIFKGFINSINGSLNEEVGNDVKGILNLYEACHLRIHGEDVLDEALVLTTNKLKHFVQHDALSHALKEQVSRALEKALHKRVIHLESLHYMKVYEQDPMHNKTLLRFAKVDFNLLQSSHKKQLCDISRWWKKIGLNAKLPIRDRIAECYVWGTAIFEPQNSIGKKITAVVAQLLTSLDDVYDAFGMIEELNIFTHAVQRWDRSCLDQLPKEYRWVYETLILDPFEEMERDLAAKGRSEYVYYARQEVKALCRSYLIEVSWRQRKYIPTFDEYMEIVVRDSGFIPLILCMWLDMEVATHDAFHWICSAPKPMQSVCLLLRILNDIGSSEVDRVRGHLPFLIASYMKQYDVTYEEACKVLSDKTQELWKDINETMMLPTEVPMPLLKAMLNAARLLEYTYDGGVDLFTVVNQGCREDITSLFINPIPIYNYD